jgi:hypothetical protein
MSPKTREKPREKRLLKSYFKTFLEQPPRNRAFALAESN